MLLSAYMKIQCTAILLDRMNLKNWGGGYSPPSPSLVYTLVLDQPAWYVATLQSQDTTSLVTSMIKLSIEWHSIDKCILCWEGQ